MNMFKKIVFSIFFLASLWGASAQSVPGSWKSIPMRGTTIDYVQDTPSKVYYLTGNSLFSYDKEANETVYHTPRTKISDAGIKFMRYNGDKKYLVLVYSNSNIDLVYDNGKIVNLPEIKDANLNVSKTINDIQFGKDRIYVATSFGIVVFDDVNHHVIESGIYNENIPSVCEMGDYILLWRKINNSECVFMSDKRDRHNTLDKFTQVKSVTSENLQPLSDTSYLALNGNNVYRVNFDFSRPVEDIVGVETIAPNIGAKKLNKYKDGFYAAGTKGFYLFDKDGNLKGDVVAYPSSFTSQNLSFWDAPTMFWGGNADGLAGYSLSNGTAEVVFDKFFPESSRQYKTWYRVNHPNGDEVYFSEGGRTEFFLGIDSGNNFFNYALNHETYNWRTGELKYVAPLIDGNLFYGGSSRVLFDQEDPSYVYIGNLFYGLQVVKDRDYVINYSDYNSPLHSRWGGQIYDMAFDGNGNLWMFMWMISTGYIEGSNASPLKILPKESIEILKTPGGPEKLTQKVNGEFPYWLQPDWVNGNMGKCDAKMIFSTKVKSKGLVACGGWESMLVGIDNKGTTSIDDDTYLAYAGFRDQDGTVSSPIYKSWFEEDKNGWIWIGTDAGIYVIKDIEQLADGSSNYIEVVRPKVARNDGTDYADYLLSSDLIYNIAVDSNNRKWIGTSTSGLYCVSPDGTEIIYEFNKDNSPLISNTVTMVACDPHGNDILIGSPEGLFVYSCDAAPANEDYSEVYAIPNPVRPDYTGWITINGLMDNSLVKVTDSQGHVVWQGKSEGGMAVWDGCDANGNRVRSGVYMVMASQNTDGTSGAVVTKIVVIN